MHEEGFPNQKAIPRALDFPKVNVKENQSGVIGHWHLYPDYSGSLLMDILLVFPPYILLSPADPR